MKDKKQIVPQETYKMLDVITEMWPEDEREYLIGLMATRLSDHYGERWKDKEHCLNCGALMRMYTYTINKTAARTLAKLAGVVRDRVAALKPFTEANKLYISGLHDVLTATETDQKTILRYHGLIAKVKEGGKHKDNLWAITRWGWAFLRGEAMSKSVTVWRGIIQERSPEMITIREALATEGTVWDNRHYDFAPHEGELI